MLALCIPVKAQQLDNMSFDQWYKDGKCWNPWPENATNHSWDTANRALSFFGVNGAVPEYEHVAVKGPGKAAVKVQTTSFMGILVAGSVFTGRYLGLVRMSGAKLEVGVPFTGRPKSLSGYIHYIPGKINEVSKNMQHLKGTTDCARIEVSIRDGEDLEIVDTTDKQFQKEKGANAPHTVGHGAMIFRENTKGYIHFEIPINYKNDNIPTNIAITVSASRYAQQFTGSTDSVMYLDELELNY